MTTTAKPTKRAQRPKPGRPRRDSIRLNLSPQELTVIIDALESESALQLRLRARLAEAVTK